MLDECYEPPSTYDVSKAAEFAQQSYARWAMQEIIRYVGKNSNTPIYILMEEFRSKMDDAACEAKDPSKNFMFSVAYDVATDVLDYFLTYEERAYKPFA